MRVICALYEIGSLRYGKLKKKMHTITDAVLTSTLKELMADGIVNRLQYEEIPPRVEYSLSEKGLSIIPLLHGICQWTEAHCGDSGGVHLLCFAATANISEKSEKGPDTEFYEL